MASDSTHEQTVNVALGEVLGKMRGSSWTVSADRRGEVLKERGWPDVLVLDAAGWPVVIEAKHHPGHALAEDAATDRLGKHPVKGRYPIETAIALVYPPEFQQLDGEALRAAIGETDALEYALHTHVADDERGRERLPERGWLRGSIIDLAMLVHRAATPARRVEELADVLAGGIGDAADRFSDHHPRFGEGRGAQLAAILEQTDDHNGQTRRMAMTVLLNALIFHEALAQADFDVWTGNRRRPVQSIDVFCGLMLKRTELLDEWRAILRHNYLPIFSTARRLLAPSLMPIMTASDVLQPLCYTAQSLVRSGVTRSHDLMGTVVQRLIADRKFLAANYTRPEAAAMLAGLALLPGDPPRGSWNGRALRDVQIGDFACGTGTLLSAAYQRLSLLHELHGGDAKALHGPMMEHGLYGLDVLNIAVHLTAAMLASAHPDTPFDGECLLVMPYGVPKRRGAPDEASEPPVDQETVRVGSNELLAAEVQAGLVEQAAATTAGGRRRADVRDLIGRVGHGEFDLVIMNPPFVRNTNHEGALQDVPLPAYAAFETPNNMQTAMAERERVLAGQSSANGNAGMASFFTELSHRKVRAGGRIAQVLPLSALSGGSWEGTRRQWREHYRDLIAVTIATGKSRDASFSSDTGIAECLIVATRNAEPSPASRGVFVILTRRPASTHYGDLMAATVQRAIQSGDVRRLDDGPLGTTPLMLGDEYCGHLLDCPLPDDGPWPLVGVADVELAQVAYRLAHGQLASIGQSTTAHTEIPVALIGEVAERGPVHRDIDRTERDGTVRGPFERRGITSGAPSYPMLWAHDAKKERSLVVEPDQEGQIKSVDARSGQQAVNEKADRIQATATRAHYNCDLQFNSQSLVVAMTERPCIGGTAWPSVIFGNRDHEYAFALWSNSTLGLLLHWWTANKTQSGRGRTTVTGIPYIPTLDVRALSDEQHERARAAFEALRGARFLPFDQIDQGDARAELDRALLVDVLGLPEALCADGGPLETLRRKIVSEPQIHGGKKSKVVFTDDGERTVQRSVAEMAARQP